MKEYGNVMGPRNALVGGGWIEVNLPYWENRNEEEIEEDPDYRGPMPSWEIWDWLEYCIPNMHDDINGDVGWWATSGKFSFFFREKRLAAKFALRFGGEIFAI